MKFSVDVFKCFSGKSKEGKPYHLAQVRIPAGTGEVGTIFSDVPLEQEDDVEVDINPLQELSVKEEASVELLKAQAALMRKQSLSQTPTVSTVKAAGSPLNTGLNSFGELSAVSSLDEADKPLFVGFFKPVVNRDVDLLTRIQDIVKTILNLTEIPELHATVFYKEKAQQLDAIKAFFLPFQCVHNKKSRVYLLPCFFRYA